MEGLIEQVHNEQPMPQPISEQKAPNEMAPPEPIQYDFFIPPPINQLNSKYHQNFSTNSESVFKTLTPNYQCFREQLPFNVNSDESRMFQIESLESLKERLALYNREVYVAMLKLLANQGNGQPTNKTASTNLQKELREKVNNFKDTCIKTKVLQTHTSLLKKMTEDTAKITEKTNEIRAQIQQIKNQFEENSGNIRIQEEYDDSQHRYVKDENLFD